MRAFLTQALPLNFSQPRIYQLKMQLEALTFYPHQFIKVRLKRSVVQIKSYFTQINIL